MELLITLLKLDITLQQSITRNISRRNRVSFSLSTKQKSTDLNIQTVVAGTVVFEKSSYVRCPVFGKHLSHIDSIYHSPVDFPLVSGFYSGRFRIALAVAQCLCVGKFSYVYVLYLNISSDPLLPQREWKFSCHGGGGGGEKTRLELSC